jgi:hypothetical protein
MIKIFSLKNKKVKKYLFGVFFVVAALGAGGYYFYEKFDYEVELPDLVLPDESINEDGRGFSDNVSSLLVPEYDRGDRDEEGEGEEIAEVEEAGEDSVVDRREDRLESDSRDGDFEDRLGKMGDAYNEYFVELFKRNELLLKKIENLEEEIVELKRGEQKLALRENSSGYNFLLIELLNLANKARSGDNFREDLGVLYELAKEDEFVLTKLDILDDIAYLPKREELFLDLSEFEDDLIRKRKIEKRKEENGSGFFNVMSEFVKVKKVRNFAKGDPLGVVAKVRGDLEVENYVGAYDKVYEFEGDDDARNIIASLSIYRDFEKAIEDIKGHILEISRD